MLLLTGWASSGRAGAPVMRATGVGPCRKRMCSSRPGPGRLSGPRPRGGHARRRGAGRDRQERPCHQGRLTGREPAAGRGRAGRAAAASATSRFRGLRTRAGHAQGPGWFVNRSPTVTLNGHTVQASSLCRPNAVLRTHPALDRPLRAPGVASWAAAAALTTIGAPSARAVQAEQPARRLGRGRPGEAFARVGGTATRT
jgi:hypothetical protein